MSGTLELIRRGFIRMKRKIVRMSASYERYLIYLPEDYNDIWREIYEKKLKVEVYIRPLEEQARGTNRN